MADRNGYIGRAPSDSSVVVARQLFEPTGVTTTFTFAAGYTVGYLDVYLNGARLIEGRDYNATSGSTVDLDSAATSGDVLELVAYKAFNVAMPTSTGDLTVGGDLTVTGFITANTYYGDGSNLTGLPQSGIGIQSAGNIIGTGVTSINFIGVGNTFAVNGTTVDISIAGGGSGVSTTGVSTAAIWSNPSFITTSYTLDDGNNNYGVFGPFAVGVGATINVGAGNTFVIV